LVPFARSFSGSSPPDILRASRLSGSPILLDGTKFRAALVLGEQSAPPG